MIKAESSVNLDNANTETDDTLFILVFEMRIHNARPFDSLPIIYTLKCEEASGWETRIPDFLQRNYVIKSNQISDE